MKSKNLPQLIGYDVLVYAAANGGCSSALQWLAQSPYRSAMKIWEDDALAASYTLWLLDTTGVLKGCKHSSMDAQKYAKRCRSCRLALRRQAAPTPEDVRRVIREFVKYQQVENAVRKWFKAHSLKLYSE